MRKLIQALLAILLVAIAMGQGRQEDIKIVFSDTDIGQVLRAISIRTGASIVYSGKDKVPVTLNVTVSNVEEAVKSATAAAGLVYRKVGSLFVVASSESMRQVLLPYSETASVTLPEGVAAKVLNSIEESFPHLTVKAVGNRITLKGLAYDLAQARTMIEELAANEEARRPVTDTVQIAFGSPADLAKAITAVYPEVVATPVAPAATPAAPDRPSVIPRGGALILTGPISQVPLAKELAKKLDLIPAGEGENKTIYKVLELKYLNAPLLKEFLAKAVPEVEAYVGPENYVPQRAKFQPLSSTITGSQSGGLGGGAGGSSQSGNSQDLGPTPGGTQQGSAGIAQTGTQKSKTVVIKGPQGAIDQASRLASQLDIKPQQVMVEVKVVETSKTFSENVGLKFGWTPFQFFEATPGNKVAVDGTSLTQPNTNPAGLGQFSRAPLGFTATLNALIDNGNAKVLASPSVQVIDNEDANVFIGSTIRARIAQASALGGQTVDIREFPVGIVLLLHPRVNGDNEITMHVNPVVSTVTSLTTDNVPQTSSREAETTVIVRDGETIVIGGLIRDEYSKAITEVPFLSKIPILGQLFRNRKTSKDRTEVIVTITPRIIRDPVPGGK